MPGLLSFCSVSVRGNDVYRCRPERGLEFCRHTPGSDQPESLGGYPSISAPILTKEHGIYGGPGRPALRGIPVRRQGTVVVRDGLTGHRSPHRSACATGELPSAAKTATSTSWVPTARPRLPTRDLEIWKIRHPLTGSRTAAEFDWAHELSATPPARTPTIRASHRLCASSGFGRYEGTFKHLPVCGGGRMYTHTSEGADHRHRARDGASALWRRYFPDVYLSFTSPLYREERLLIPQAGLKRSLPPVARLRPPAGFNGKCRSPGSPSWSRQAPPVVHDGLAIYAFGSGKYAPQGTEKAYVMKGDPQPRADGEEVMSFIYTHNNPYYPKGQPARHSCLEPRNGQGSLDPATSPKWAAAATTAALCLSGAARSTTRPSSATIPAAARSLRPPG